MKGWDVRWDVRTGEFRGVAQHNKADTLAPSRMQQEASNLTRSVERAVTATGVQQYVIRDKSGAPASGTAVIEPGVSEINSTARLSPDGTRLLVLSVPPKLYDVATGREVLTLHREEVRGTDQQFALPLFDGLWSADGTQFWYAVDSKGKLVGFDARPLPEPKP